MQFRQRSEPLCGFFTIDAVAFAALENDDYAPECQSDSVCELERHAIRFRQNSESLTNAQNQTVSSTAFRPGRGGRAPLKARFDSTSAER
jgi:hypothetical protein